MQNPATMPKAKTYISVEDLRLWTELFTWRDRLGVEQEGPNPPDEYRATAERKPFSVKYVTRDGRRHGEPRGDRVVCIAVIPGGERLIRYVDSGEVRRIRDSLIYWVNGYEVR